MKTYIPTKAMQQCGERALEYRKQYGRALTPVGVARAVQLKNLKPLSENTVKRMYSYFSRHAVDKESASWVNGHRDGGPSNGRIAWLAWGGDPGYVWCKRILGK